MAQSSAGGYSVPRDQTQHGRHVDAVVHRARKSTRPYDCHAGHRSARYGKQLTSGVAGRYEQRESRCDIVPHHRSDMEPKIGEDDEPCREWQHRRHAGHNPGSMSRGIVTVVGSTGYRMLVCRPWGMHLAFDDHCGSHTDQQHSKHNIRFTMHLRYHSPPRSQCY